MVGATWKCCRLGASSVYTIQPCTVSLHAKPHTSGARVFNCNLHFRQNDRDLLRATAVTRGWNRYRNKSQHRKSTLEKKILPPLLQGFEPATFRSRVRRSNDWAIPAAVKSWKHSSFFQQYCVAVKWLNHPFFLSLLVMVTGSEHIKLLPWLDFFRRNCVTAWRIKFHILLWRNKEFLGILWQYCFAVNELKFPIFVGTGF